MSGEQAPKASYQETADRNMMTDWLQLVIDVDNGFNWSSKTYFPFACVANSLVTQPHTSSIYISQKKTLIESSEHLFYKGKISILVNVI